MKPVCLITGANRGIGLSLAKHYLKEGYFVIAACRVPEKAPELLKVSCKVVSLDVGSDQSISNLAQQLLKEKIKLNLLINNAGVLIRDDLESCKRQDLLNLYNINAVGPVLLTQALLPLLGAESKVVCITSSMGSIGENGSGGYYSYRASKCALNCLVKSMMYDLKKLNIPVLALHPGYIQTDMTGGRGDMGPDECVEIMTKRISELDMEKSGKYQHRDGRFILY
jgi:NAD(P)-dependent dehydrogenase (short-subunit alcohol dehydrogenase family)